MLALRETEEHLVREIEAYLETRFPEDAALVRQRFKALQALGEAVSSFPSVREAHTLRGEVRDEDKLIEALCTFIPSARLLHTPTKIVASRSYLIAKAHAFSLLSILVQDTDQFYVPVRGVIFSIICTIMSEEVYLSFLADPAFSGDIKFRLANDLIALWDSGTDPRAVHHVSALEALWSAREEAPPSFGTMDGTSELVRVSLELEADWRDFLVSHTADEETRWALEEFLFGLSYEEIIEIRSRLNRFGISAVNYDEIRFFLGHNPSYTEVITADPRSIYDFYVARRDAAAFRKQAAAPGPKRTLEEAYLYYRITLE